MEKISKKELEKIFSLIVKKLSTDKIEDISFDIDEYWIITTDEWNNFINIPEPAVGSLSDDISSLKKSIDSNEIISYTDFDRIASILRAISEIKAPLFAVDSDH